MFIPISLWGCTSKRFYWGLINVKTYMRISKCQKRVQDNFDNDKYVCECENPYGRVKTHF